MSKHVARQSIIISLNNHQLQITANWFFIIEEICCVGSHHRQYPKVLNPGDRFTNSKLSKQHISLEVCHPYWKRAKHVCKCFVKSNRIVFWADVLSVPRYFKHYLNICTKPQTTSNTYSFTIWKGTKNNILDKSSWNKFKAGCIIVIFSSSRRYRVNR